MCVLGLSHVSEGVLEECYGICLTETTRACHLCVSIWLLSGHETINQHLISMAQWIYFLTLGVIPLGSKYTTIEACHDITIKLWKIYLLNLIYGVDIIKPQYPKTASYTSVSNDHIICKWLMSVVATHNLSIKITNRKLNYQLKLLRQLETYSGQVQSPFFISITFKLSLLGPSSRHFMHCVFLAKFKKLQLQQNWQTISSWTNKHIITNLECKAWKRTKTTMLQEGRQQDIWKSSSDNKS